MPRLERQRRSRGDSSAAPLGRSGVSGLHLGIACDHEQIAAKHRVDRSVSEVVLGVEHRRTEIRQVHVGGRLGPEYASEYASERARGHVGA